MYQEFVKHSLKFLKEREQDSFINTLATNPCFSIRSNPYKPYFNDLSLEKVAWSDSGYYLTEKKTFTLDPFLHSGVYYVQEASSMFVEQFIKEIALPDEAVALDLCASPGGKSTHLLGLLKPSQMLVSNEVIKTRVSTLKENLIKWGCENMVVTHNDSEDFGALDGFFDLVVVDAPCSGEGMFRKDANAINEWSIANVDICYKRQRRILTEIESAIKDGGYLLYSTCTYNTLEDEENIKWFIESYGYEEVKIDSIKFTGVLNCEYGYKMMPHLVKGEGFYICCLRKKGELDTYDFPKSKRSNLDTYKNRSEVAEYFTNAEEIDFFTFNEHVKALRSNQKQVVDMLSRSLNLVTVGLDVAELLKGKQLLPSHSMALNRYVNKDYFKAVELSKDDALRYLKKELNDIECKNGLHLACYLGAPLGFFKKIQNRINNNYPQEWRIRMDL
jgi:16S rRNA C967 or C1407 C5-methylase (RsmB/RsmF family)/NOL1/NOP2/fmu family ribosome biogenesis protein